MKKSRVLVVIVVFLLLAVGVAWYRSGYMPMSLRFDSDGIAHGTGTAQYSYQSGALKLEDRYVAGQIVEATWYRPDGSIIANEHFQDGCGTGYYLREDGSIRVKMTYVKGIAEGPATYYTVDGEIDRVVKFVNGQEQRQD